MPVAEASELHQKPIAESLPAWPNTFQVGEFVRVVNFPQYWGIIIGPSEHEGRWIFEYSGGTRVTNRADAFQKFQPEAWQRRQLTQRIAQLANVAVGAWPDRAV